MDEQTASASALAECDRLIGGLRHEANKNQRLAWLASLAIVLSSAAVPVLIVISTETGAFLFGKLLPAAAGALAAVAAGSAQIFRPHERWRMDRAQQRLLEAERLSYIHGVGDYAHNDKERLLVERLVAVRRLVVEDWQTLVPDTPRAIAALQDRSSSR